MFVFKYRKKPEEVGAVKYNDHNASEIADWIDIPGTIEEDIAGGLALFIPSVENIIVARVGSFVTKDLYGKVSIYTPTEFGRKYEPVMKRCNSAACNCGLSHHVGETL